MMFSDDLKKMARPILEEIYHHPFVTGIAKGQVAKKALIFYVEQDYRYLTEFIKIYANAIIKLDSRQDMAFFSDAINFILNNESFPHQVFCQIADVDYKKLQHADPAPKAYLYESHMHQAVDTGSLLTVLAAFQPCPWTYTEIAKKQISEGANNQRNPFTPWINFYGESSDDGNEPLANQIFLWMDRLAARSSDKEKNQARDFFLKSCELEWQFWEEAYYQQDWRFKKVIRQLQEIS
ncbi:thiaminase II [Oenococcus sicerae]|nr:thiaminase II [Oenococcus sicerae]